MSKQLMSIVLAFLVCVVFITHISAKIPDDATYIGSETCGACHDDVAQAFRYNVHRVSISAWDGENIACESCHGRGSAHADEGDPYLIRTFSEDYEYGEDNPCLDCHEGYPSAYLGDHHPAIEEGCSGCHQVHSDNEDLLVKSEENLCFDCHVEKMAEFRMPSHHPVTEGFMNCTDCHAPHGKKSVQFVGMMNSRERCLGCHAEKQGPYIFEHAPVNEDCMICHKAHGSVADNLLTQSEPFLCLSCHPAHFHSTLTGYTGSVYDSPSPVGPDRGGESNVHSFKKVMLTKCTQCHTQVHGSDLPAQSVSGQGKGMTR